MAKVRAKFRTRTKEYYYTDKYKTKTFNVELPMNNFHEYDKAVDMIALKKIIANLIDTEHPETHNNLMYITILR